jgi:hypothetical protein
MKNLVIPICMAAVLLALPAAAVASVPNCSGWPTNMAFVHLKNAGLTDNSQTDPSKATAVRLASEKVGKDLYREIYRITFHTKSGSDIVVITSSEASSEECSMSAVDVFVVSKQLGGR